MQIIGTNIVNCRNDHIAVEVKSKTSQNAKMGKFAESIQKHSKPSECFVRDEDIIKNECSHINKFPPEILRHCLSFIGGGNYIFIATVSSAFHNSYTEYHKNTYTTARGSATDSLSCAKLCFCEDRPDINNSIFRSAAAKGNTEIIEHAIAHYSIPRNVFFHSNRYGGREPVSECLFEDIGQHWDILQLTHDKFDLRWLFCCIGAARANREDIIMWISNYLGREEIDRIMLELKYKHKRNKEAHKVIACLDSTEIQG